MMYYIYEFLRKVYYLFWKSTHLSLYKKPELIVPHDPLYCYTILQYHSNGNFDINPCLFHKDLFGDLCMLNGDWCCGDWCKTCDINNEWNEHIIIEGGK